MSVLNIKTEENEILKTALLHINVHVFVYDICSKRMSFVDLLPPPCGLPLHLEDGINHILVNNILFKQSVEDFKTLFDRALGGAPVSVATIKLRNGAQPSFYRILLTDCFDKQGVPVSIVGTMQDVTDRVSIERRYTKEEQYRLAMLADSRRVYEVNVTRNRFMRLESIVESTDYDSWEVYTEAMDNLRVNRVYEEDWDAFLKVASRDLLLKAFDDGITEFYCEYRFIGEGGELIWTSSTTHLLYDPVSGDIKGFIYVMDIDSRKKRELDLAHRAERDPLTGIYNRAAAYSLVDKELSEAVEGVTHGFMSVDIDEFKLVNDSYGHLEGDRLLVELAKRFEHVLRSGDVLARMGGDEFMILLIDVDARQMLDVSERLRNSASTITLSGSKIAPTVSTGIAVFPTDGRTFDELYKHSDEALYHAKQHGKNRAVLYGDIGRGDVGDAGALPQTPRLF